jgi:hypothetical protein
VPSYADRNRSLLYALSDFWTQIFADTDTVESMYRGAEILVGQIYLDLLGDMLNMSVRDTALFRKELFRLIRVREDVVLRAPDGRYRVPLGADIHRIETLNNKVFAVTSALEQGTDFVQIDAEGSEGSGSTGLFVADPTAAQPVLTVGSGTSATRFTGVLPGVPIRLAMVDDGTTSITSTLTFDADGALLTVNYDGPANGGSSTALKIAARLTADRVARERVLVEHLTTTGPSSAPAGIAATALSFAHGLPVSGFGARVFPATFGTKFSAPRTATYGASIGVAKGDILRLEPSARSGGLYEVPIALVRDGALYSHFAAVPVGSEPAVLTRRDYSILRTPSDYKVEGEAWIVDTYPALIGSVDRATSTLEILGLPLIDAWGMMTDTVWLGGARNAGPVTLASWDAGTERFTIYAADIEDEASVLLYATSELTHTYSTGVFNIVPVSGEPGFYDLTGFVANELAVGGVLFITDNLAVPGVRARVTAYDAGTIRFTDVQDDAYTMTGPPVGIALTRTQVSTDPGFVASLELDRPAYVPGEAPELRTQLLEGSLTVRGRRLLDGRALVAGTDWAYVPASHGVRWYNTPDLRAGVSFDYEIRNVLYASSDIATTLVFNAALGYVSPTDLRVKLYDQTPGTIAHVWSVGDRIELDAGVGAPNTGTYYVEEILTDGNAVVLGGGHTPVLPEPMDGSLGVVTWPTGTVDVETPQERIVEVAMWAPDIQVDRLSLASTYGYLLDRVEPSSEAYRSTLRGLMQLYMLGPTCARLEAAVHVLAGLPVVRDENELLLGYERDVVAGGSSLSLDGPSRTARLLSGEFPPSVEGFLVIETGFNAGRVFTVESKVSPTELLLTTEPFTETGATWEIVGQDTHTVVTDRNRYTLPLTLPFRPNLVDPSSFGTLRLRAFSTFTEAVQVQDEVGTPGWWQDARIPAVLWPGQPQSRLQSSPAYVEHVIDPVDEACIGDPGFHIGTDDSGVEIERKVLQAETGDLTAVLSMDPHAPFSYENATFYTALRATSVDDIGYAFWTELPNGDALELQILGIVDANTWRVALPMTLPGGSAVCQDWNLYVDTAVLRHNTAFVVFDRYLKQHVFSVEIDATLLGAIDASLLSEIQSRLREVRPAHTYLALSPSTVLTDVLDLSDELLRQRQVDTAGSGGDAVVSSENALRIDGSWRIGDYFRYVDWYRTDDISAAPPPIAQSPAGYFTDIHNIEWESGITLGGQPAELAFDLAGQGLHTPLFTSGAEIDAADASDGAWITFDDPMPAELTQSTITLAKVRIVGGVQPGVYRIGRVNPDENSIRIYIPGGVAETGITVVVESCMPFSATVSRMSDGSTVVTAPVGSLPDSPWVPRDRALLLQPGTQVGLDGTGIASGLCDPAAAWELCENRSPGVWDIGSVQVNADTDVPIGAAVVFDGSDVLLVLPPDTVFENLFAPEMGRVYRESVDPTTAGVTRSGIVFDVTAINSGMNAYIAEVRTPYIAVLEGLETSTMLEGNGPFFPWTLHAATLPPDPVTLPVRCVADLQRWFFTLPRFNNAGVLEWADVNESIASLVYYHVDTTVIAFHAYGRQSPVDIDATPMDPAAGDTPFCIGGLSPSVRAVRRRTQRDFDITELPIEITRTYVPPPPELLIMNGAPIQMNGGDTYVII